MSVPEVNCEVLPSGSRIGPWRVERCGGQGSFGTVYRVQRVQLEEERPFALKLSRPVG
jgi:hypothetical protein